MTSPSAPEADAADLWDYALALYARPGVAQACLRAQDEAGLDVNILLLCCWLAARGRGALDAAGARCVAAAATPWQRAVLGPLRRARRRLKPVAGADARIAGVRAGLAALELRAERVEQRLLLQALREVRLVPPRGARADAAVSLDAYLRDGSRRAGWPGLRETLLAAMDAR